MLEGFTHRWQHAGYVSRKAKQPSNRFSYHRHSFRLSFSLAELCELIPQQTINKISNIDAWKSNQSQHSEDTLLFLHVLHPDAASLQRTVTPPPRDTNSTQCDRVFVHFSALSFSLMPQLTHHLLPTLLSPHVL